MTIQDCDSMITVHFHTTYTMLPEYHNLISFYLQKDDGPVTVSHAVSLISFIQRALNRDEELATGVVNSLLSNSTHPDIHFIFQLATT